MRDGSRTRLALFAALFVVFYLALDRFAVFEMSAYLWGRDDTDQPGRTAALYFAAYILGVLGWVGLHAHVSRVLRYGSYAITVLTGTAFLSFAQINEVGFGITDASLFWEEIEFTPDALMFFTGRWVPPALMLIAVVCSFEWALGTRMGRIRSRVLLAVPILSAAIFYSMLQRSDARLAQFPVPYRVTTLVAYASQNHVVWLGTRDEPYISATSEPLAPHIVFIVDESIRGDWLGLNGGLAGTTPFLSSQPDGLFNYGVSSAIANLSSPANIILQSGLRPDQLPDTEMRSMKNPNIFAYMKAAGFATFLIDAQHGFGRPPNFMTQADVDALDDHLLVRDRVGEFEVWEADYLLPPILAEIIESNQQSFSYVLKIGAHFPYSVRFDPGEATFEAETMPREYEGKRATIVAEYANTLQWAVDRFCRQLFAELEATGEDVVIVYTADHAQSLFEAWGSEGRRVRGHGHSPNPPPFQARVPLFLFATGDGPRAKLTTLYDPGLRDRTSAFELFPTLLRMAGYSEADIRSRYQHTLFDREADRSHRVFVSGNHFGADGPLYRDAPYRSSFGLNDFSVEAR